MTTVTLNTFALRHPEGMLVTDTDLPRLFPTYEMAQQGASDMTSMFGTTYEIVVIPQRSVEGLDSPSDVTNAIALYDHVRQERDNLKDSLRVAHHAISEARIKHEQDIERIGERLMQEASDRDWCREYDGVVDSLNRHLNVCLPVREQDFTVTFTVSVDVQVPQSATDGETAVDFARECFGSEDIISAVRNGCNWDIEETSYEYDG